MSNQATLRRIQAIDACDIEIVRTYVGQDCDLIRAAVTLGIPQFDVREAIRRFSKGHAWRGGNGIIPSRMGGGSAARLVLSLCIPVVRQTPVTKDAGKRKTQEETREWFRAYARRRRASDPSFKLAQLLRNRLNGAIRHGRKAGSPVRDLGCTVGDLKQHLESQFVPGMGWHNHGEWEIDHILPLASVDLTNREEFLRVCHYTNLQPDVGSRE